MAGEKELARCCELPQVPGWHVSAMMDSPPEQGASGLLDIQGLLRRQKELLSLRVDDDAQDLEAGASFEEVFFRRELQPQPREQQLHQGA
jgi:hypothetical protein